MIIFYVYDGLKYLLFFLGSIPIDFLFVGVDIQSIVGRKDE